MPRRKNTETEESASTLRRRAGDGGQKDDRYEEKPAHGRGSRKRTKMQEQDEYFANIAREVDEDDDIESDGEEVPLRKTNLEAGQIRRIYVENFMCHRKFSIELGEGLNFIIGKNGSGTVSYSVVWL